jgi:hypothetical protein
MKPATFPVSSLYIRRVFGKQYIYIYIYITRKKNENNIEGDYNVEREEHVPHVDLSSTSKPPTQIRKPKHPHLEGQPGKGSHK